MVILKGVDFGNVFCSSGSRGFFDEGYWPHNFFRLSRGFDFEGSAFVSKTATWSPEAGNLLLDENFRPKERFPGCVKIYFARGISLNAVAWSNPGLAALSDKGLWQKIETPFLISVGILGKTALRRISEIRAAAWYLREKVLPNCRSSVGLEINWECPNIGNEQGDGTSLKEILLVARGILDIPIIIKIGISTSTAVVKEIEDYNLCDAISLINAVRWGDLPDKIPWRKLFGTNVSPLAKYGGGALSGWPLTELAIRRVAELRDAGIDLPIIAGGGIGCRRSWRQDIDALKSAGADAISIGIATNLRFWRVTEIIKYGREVFGG